MTLMRFMVEENRSKNIHAYYTNAPYDKVIDIWEIADGIISGQDRIVYMEKVLKLLGYNFNKKELHDVVELDCTNGYYEAI